MLDVSCAVQGSYVPHSAAMLHSVLTATEGHAVRVHYLHGPGLRRRDRRRLAGMVGELGGELRLHEIAEERIADLPVSDYFTSAMWYRVLLPELLPDAERVLYLDVDTLALDSIAPLWDVDLSGALLAAVTNVFMSWQAHRPVKDLGLSGPEVYFNSGVLLMNLEAMRAEDTAAAVRAYAVGNDLEWPDQDALNVVLGARRVALARAGTR